MRPRHLYVHVPFCARRCSYCDFSIAVRAATPVREYLDGLRRELELRYRPGQAWEMSTLYFGGGTPSRLGGEGVRHAVELITDRASIADGAEVTLEANPDDVTLAGVRAWREAGINRLSIGAQSFDDAVLRWMHRTHDATQIERAVETARAGGIHDFSIDLIFALPTALGRDWRADLTRAVALRPPHISLYGLTVEPHTPLGRWRDRGEADEAPEESYVAEFLLAHELLTDAGYEHYEVSNYALPGHRARHNSTYWRRQPYGGVGPSAHEFDGERRRWNVAAYAEWLRRVRAGADPIAGDELLTPEQRQAEEVYLGLRTDAGLDIAPEERPRVESWVAAGWARLVGDRLRLTPTGWLRLDALAAGLTHSGSRF